MEPDQKPVAPHKPHMGILDEKTFSKYFLLILFLLSLVAFLSVIRVFILDIVLAAVFSTLFYPLFALLLGAMKRNRGLAAFFSCLLILLCLLIPLLFIFNVVILQGIDLYHNALPVVESFIEKGGTGFFGKFQGTIIGRWLIDLHVDWKTVLSGGLQLLGGGTAKIINKASQLTIGLVVNLFIILFSMFYFFRDGQKILERVRSVVPLGDEYKDRIISRFITISSATVKGSLLIALLQAFLGTVTLWAFGSSAWLLWGVIMMVFALIPFVGTGGILVPAGIIKIATGETWQGIAIILISVCIISTIDNLLRPRLVGMHAGMHDLMIFFSTLGGITVFGPSGFIIGPLVAAIFLTVLDIFSIEFQEHIEYPSK
jgi:predicted PurR-regulated permease PerM